MPRISVVLPIYRTAQYLRELYARLVAALEPEGSFELIMVDDASPDHAWEIVSELATSDVRVKAIRLSRNFGQHPAISAAFEVANGEILVLMDSDLQDQPEDIPLLIQSLRDDVDIVYTVKQGREEPIFTRLTSNVYHLVFSRLTRNVVPRNIGTFRIFTRRVLDALLAYPERDVLYGPLMFHVGFQYAVVPVQHQPRIGSRSAYSFRARLLLAINSLVSYTDLPHRFLVWFGISVLSAGVVYAIILIVRYLFVNEQLPPGLTLLALLTTISLGAMMTGLGIIGIYVFRVFQEVLRRPRYLVGRSVNLGNNQISGSKDR